MTEPRQPKDLPKTPTPHPPPEPNPTDIEDAEPKGRPTSDRHQTETGAGSP